MRKISLLFAFLLSAAVWADDGGTRCLVVETVDGGVAYYDFGASPEIRFNGSALTIVTDAESVEYGEREVAQYYFAVRDNGPATPVDAQQGQKIVFRRVSADEVLVAGAQSVGLLTIDGRAVTGRATASADGIRVDLSALPSGVYLLNINNKQQIKIKR